MTSRYLKSTEVTSATSDVLGTTELLEQILLDMVTPDGQSNLILSPDVRQLFLMQRVSHKFNATIQRSLGIRRRMMLAHLDPHDERLPFGMDYAFKQRTSLLSFVANSHGCRISHVSHDQSEPRKRGVIHVKGFLCSDGSTRTSSLHGNTASTTTISSWRGMKLCSHPQSVALYLFMTIEPGMSYMSMLALDHHMDTLGILDDSVKKVLSRSRDEHIKYMKDHRKVSTIFNGSIILWRSIRQDLPSMLKNPNVVKLREAQRLHAMQRDCGRSAGNCTFCASTSRGKYARVMMRDIATENAD